MKMRKILLTVLLAVLVMSVIALPVLAANESETTAAVAAAQEETPSADSGLSAKAIAAAIAIAAAAGAGAIAMGMAIGKSVEGIYRQPEATNNIRTVLMLGLVFIETAIIYALIVAILVVFVL